MFALALCLTLLVALVLFSVHDPFRAVRLLNVFLPFVPSHSSPFAVLLPICFVLLCSILYFYWQLHNFWHCQKHFEETKRWNNSKVKGYAELYVADPFFSCLSVEKQPLKQKHSRRKGKEENENIDETKPTIQTRVTLCEVLPDYQVFSLDEEEPKAKRRAEEESQQQKQKETNSQIRGNG
ncbi:hypothetical protein niasHT_015795 [Heterodera trifolii]|uniref:Uncharacterized protein n=1 Tax=Heterodera trifolii TaxID=157864 RepID=A0ABD2L4P6_9BILA